MNNECLNINMFVMWVEQVDGCDIFKLMEDGILYICEFILNKDFNWLDYVFENYYSLMLLN